MRAFTAHTVSRSPLYLSSHFRVCRGILSFCLCISEPDAGKGEPAEECWYTNGHMHTAMLYLSKWAQAYCGGSIRATVHCFNESEDKPFLVESFASALPFSFINKPCIIKRTPFLFSLFPNALEGAACRGCVSDQPRVRKGRKNIMSRKSNKDRS